MCEQCFPVKKKERLVSLVKVPLGTPMLVYDFLIALSYTKKSREWSYFLPEKIKRNHDVSRHTTCKNHMGLL